MEQWKEYRLGDIVNLVIDYRGKTPLKLGGSWSQNGYRALSAKNIKTGAIVNEDSIRFVDEELYRRWMKDEVQRGDIFVTSEAPFGQIYYWNSDEKIVLSQRLFCLRLSEEVCSKFVYYYMITNTFQAELDGRATGTTVIGLRQPELLKCKINLPSLAEQQRIASILSSLDEKIEVNRRINSNLEEQAKALFKSWFIDFEPFKDGKFVDSEFGMIPERWNMMSFESFISESQDKAMVGTYPAYSVTNNGITPRTEKFKKQLSKATSKEKILRKNDLVFGMSRQILNWGIMQDEIGSVSSAYHVYKIDKERTCPTYLRYFIKGYESYFRDLIGTAAREGQSLDKGALMNKKLLVPSKEILRSFIQHVTTIENTISLFKSQCRRLSTLRDTLLPRLMSGEIEVRS